MKFSAVLLAGGESRRMGRDKATLEWRGRALWEWQIDKLRALQPEKIFVSARTDPAWRPADVELIVDATPSRGPLSGLVATLATIETDHLLALAIDLPFMTAEHLRFLCSLVTPRSGVVPTIDGKAEPLAAIYPREVKALFLAALEGDNFSLQPIVKKMLECGMLRAMPVSDSARQLYQNVNEICDLD